VRSVGKIAVSVFFHSPLCYFSETVSHSFLLYDSEIAVKCTKESTAAGNGVYASETLRNVFFGLPPLDPVAKRRRLDKPGTHGPSRARSPIFPGANERERGELELLFGGDA
jgi:hypothetical protein